jgi:hypothetical protein
MCQRTLAQAFFRVAANGSLTEMSSNPKSDFPRLLQLLVS